MRSRALLAILIIAVVAGVGILAYILANPKVEERFTEFYILGLNGKAGDYPTELVVGEEGKVIVGIINRELDSITYRVEVVTDGAKTSELGPVTLEHGENWEGTVSFTASRWSNQKVEFLLYRQEQNEVYQALHLRVAAYYLSGIFAEDFIFQSDDGMCQVTINEGTIGLTEDGEPLSELTIIEIDPPGPPPADYSVIGLTYNLGPDGATFEPPIPVTFTYEESLIPDGVAEEDLVIALWVSTGWAIREGGIVNPVSDTITISTNHFTGFTILVYTPHLSPRDNYGRSY